MTLTLYMKSGNKIVLKGIKDYKYGYKGNEIISLTIERQKWAQIASKFFGTEVLPVGSTDLSQIEALTVRRIFS
jgi:hypothetical protein